VQQAIAGAKLALLARCLWPFVGYSVEKVWAAGATKVIKKTIRGIIQFGAH
jgi:hypothetical protein